MDRGLWLVAVLCMAGGMIYTLHNLFQRYHTFPHSTTVSINQRDYLPFPAVTLCLGDSLDRDRLRDAFPWAHPWLETFFLHRGVTDWSDPEVRQILDNVTMQQVMDKASFSSEEIVVKGFYGYARTPVNGSHNLLTRDMLDGERPRRCFVFNAAGRADANKLRFSVADALTMYLRVPQDTLLPMSDVGGMRVFVHSSWNVPTTWQKMDMAFGTHVRLMVTAEKFKYLPAPYNSMGGQDCRDTQDQDFQSPLRHFDTYSQMNCMWEHVTQTASSKCNCTTIGSVGNKHLPPCSILQTQECYLPQSDKAEQVVMLVTPSNKHCVPECSTWVLETTSTAVPFPSRLYRKYLMANNETGSFIDRDSIKLTVQFQKDVVYQTEHVPALTLENIYSVMGGQMGLFLGASLLTVAENVEYVCSVLWRCARHLCCRWKRD